MLSGSILAAFKFRTFESECDVTDENLHDGLEKTLINAIPRNFSKNARYCTLPCLNQGIMDQFLALPPSLFLRIFDLINFLLILNVSCVTPCHPWPDYIELPIALNCLYYMFTSLHYCMNLCTCLNCMYCLFSTLLYCMYTPCCRHLMVNGILESSKSTASGIPSLHDVYRHHTLLLKYVLRLCKSDDTIPLISLAWGVSFLDGIYS